MGRFIVSPARRFAAALLALFFVLPAAGPFAARAAVPSLADTLAEVRRLEALADAWAGEHPGADPVTLTVNYLCDARYDDPLWSLVLGGGDEDFSAHVQQADPGLEALRSLGDVALPTGETVDFLHLVAAAGAGYGYGMPQIVCSWGGDCVQLAASARGVSDDTEACYAALSAGFAAADGTGYFPLSDWLADLDGVNIGQRLLAGERLSAALEGYYGELAARDDPATARSETFVALQFGGADTGDADAFRALVWDTFFADAGVQLFLLANEYADVNDEGETVLRADMEAPLRAACRLAADRLASDLGGAAVDPPAPTPGPGATPAPTSAPQEQQAEAGLWAAARQNPGLLLAAMGLLAAAFLATAAALWRMSR